MRAARVLLAVASLVAGASCAGDESFPEDTAAAVPEVAEDTMSAEPAIVQQGSAPESRIGRIALLGDPQAGSCAVEGDPQVGIRYTYAGDWPSRTVRVEASDSTARAAVRMLEVQARQRAGAYEEIESVYVLFDGSGGIQQGMRRYFTTETPPHREEGPLLPADTADIRRLAPLILEWCRRPAR